MIPHHEVTGEGPPLVLSNSLGATLEMWDPQMQALSQDFTVIRYDTRGHGGTAVPPGPYTLDQLAADAGAVLDALGIGMTHWCGLSMGGMIGQTLALRRPSLFATLSLCDTSSRIPAEAKPLWADRIKTAHDKGMDPLVEPTLGRWLTAPFRRTRPDVVEGVAAMIRSTPPAGYAGCCHAISALDLTEGIGAISVPTLVLVGEEDQGTPVAASKVMHERIKGSELVILPRAAHLSNLEQPVLFNTALTGFLNRHA